MTTNLKNFVVENFAELDKYSKTIAKVHGKNHPELLEVREVFLKVQEKVQQEATKEALAPEIRQLRKLTNDYQVPADGCQAYQKTYQMLQALNGVYQN